MSLALQFNLHHQQFENTTQRVQMLRAQALFTDQKQFSILATECIIDRGVASEGGEVASEVFLFGKKAGFRTSSHAKLTVNVVAP